ncbi:efflux transporter SaoE [Lagierella sp.]|uniref:efflux transporter SaoE n=1 Tax=Lagierella sp. TaxID=2849657 RepID=UPI00261C1AC9|nr:efflux transporter SaoE [Lagierella sp.]
MFGYIKEIILRSVELLNGASTWLVFSYIIAGVMRNIISPVRLQRSLGNTKFSSILKITFYSMVLPICSCGSVPLGISLYYSGAYAGPTLAFLASSPVLNPAALILSFGLLGKEIAIINIIAGLILPIVIGVIGNLVAGPELRNEMVAQEISEIDFELEKKKSIKVKILEGMEWVRTDFALTLSKYVVLGMLFGGFILTVFPESFIQKYLGNPGLLSLWNVGVLASLMYVCAVGHIPLIAALIASGASPGAAITFLMAGAATNIPEIISIAKMIGKRTAAIYTLVISAFAMLVGYITNQLLMPGFQRQMEYDKVTNAISYANHVLLSFPNWVKYLCSAIVFYFFLKTVYFKLRAYYFESRNN